MKISHILAVFLISSTLVHAHAFLDEAEPRVGSTVSIAPTQLKIWYTEKLKYDGSKIQVFDAAGNEVDSKDSKIDGDNPLLMSVSLQKLPSGHYKVVWNAIAIDTHHTSGTFTFDVKP